MRETFDYDIARWIKSLNISGNPEFIYADGRGLLWIKIWEGELFSVNGKSGRIVKYPLSEPRNAIAPRALITDMTDCGNTVAVTFNTGEIATIDTRREKITHVSHYIRERDGRKLKYSLWISPQGDYWVNGLGETYVYKRSGRRWHDNVASLLHAEGFSNVPSSLIVNDVAFEGKSDIWIATDHHGIMHIDKRGKTLKSYTYDQDETNSPADNTIICLALTDDNILWAGTLNGGVDACRRTSDAIGCWRFRNVNTIAQCRDGDVWLGTNDNGLIRLNPSTMQTAVLNKGNSGLKSDVIVSSLAATDGSMWFGTFNGGLSRYADGQIRTWMPDGTENNVSNINVWALAEDSTGNVWLGTLGTGIQRIDRKTGTFTSFGAGKNGISSNDISSMQTDSRGWIYVGTSLNCSMLNPNTMEIVNKKLPGRIGTLPSIQVTKDSRGLLWYASMAGLAVYDSQTDKYIDLGEDRLFSTSLICSVTEDHNRNIWVATENKVTMIRPYRENGKWLFTFNTYGKQDGMASRQHNMRSACLLRDGRLLIGGVDGVDVITPSELLNSTIGSPILSGLLIGDEQISVGRKYDRRVILSKPLGEGSLTLRESDRNITFTIGTDNYSANHQCHFEYMLEGFNDQWLPIDTKDPKIHFSSLPAGDYTLYVRSIGAGDGGKSSTAQLQLTVTPPFYASWWAYGIYALLIAALIYFIVARERKRQKLEMIKMAKNSRRHEDEMKIELCNRLTDEIKAPYKEISAKLFALMEKEQSETKYNSLQAVTEGLEQVFVTFNTYVDGLAKKEHLVPQITEDEIKGLDRQLVEKAMAYVEENISNDDLSVETMGKALGMSRVHLYKRLLDITGQTPSEFIRDIRIRHAERLLRYSQMNIRQISFKVGFNNPRYFAKYFKEKYGVLPSQYLAEHQGDEESQDEPAGQ